MSLQFTPQEQGLGVNLFQVGPQQQTQSPFAISKSNIPNQQFNQNPNQQSNSPDQWLVPASKTKTPVTNLGAMFDAPGSMPTPKNTTTNLGDHLLFQTRSQQPQTPATQIPTKIEPTQTSSSFDNSGEPDSLPIQSKPSSPPPKEPKPILSGSDEPDQHKLRLKLQQNENSKFQELKTRQQNRALEAADKIDQNGGDYSKLNYKELKALNKAGDPEAKKPFEAVQATKSANVAKAGNVMGAAADAIGSLIPKKQQSELTEGLNNAYDSAADTMMKVNPIVGGAMKVGGMISDGLTAMGVGTDGMTGADKILDSKFLKLTPFGLANAIGAKAADKINKDEEAFAQVGSSYGSTASDIDAAGKKSGKKYGLFSRKAWRKANAQIREAKRQQSVMAEIADKALQDTLTQSSMSDIYSNKAQFESQGGFNNRMSVGKHGMKMFNKNNILRARKNAQNAKVLKLQQTNNINSRDENNINELQQAQQFKNGGKVNVIPDGALHARLNHLDVENITNKGIPVIAKKGDKIEQQAEVEVNEIIFHKELTLKLEKLWREGTDEAAIDAGKLLVKEILENTEDNTGLIDEIEV